MTRDRHRRARLLWFAAPATFVLGIGFVYPVSQIVRDSIMISQSDISWEVMLKVQIKTIRIAGVVAGLSTLAGATVALLIRRTGLVLMRAVLFVCLFPLGVHIAFRVYGIHYLFGASGPLEHLVGWTGVHPPSWIFTETATVLGLIHWTFPVSVMMMHVAVARISQDVLDAAALLGGRGVSLLTSLVLPLLLPTLILTFSMTFCLAYGAFITPAALGGLSDITISRLLGFLLAEGRSDQASFTALVAMVIPLMVFCGLRISSAWFVDRRGLSRKG